MKIFLIMMTYYKSLKRSWKMLLNDNYFENNESLHVLKNCLFLIDIGNFKQVDVQIF